MNTFKHWSPNQHYHRWYFDDESYIEARRRNQLHRWKIETSSTNLIANHEFINRDNTPLMESIYLFTDIDLTL